ncbi:uncharacterized protein [Heptranchias perlo]|uniref:uncharacterized protein n=1 Tax=Heptranchias perlo TaxID=212740 RepID=UPI00355988AE
MYNCTCKYKITIAGRFINSTASSPIQITVTDQLPKPGITLRPRYFGNAGIECGSPIPESRFELFRNSEEESFDSQVAYGRLTHYTFSAPRQTDDSQWDYYTCRYSVQVSGRLYVSPHSEPLVVTDPEKPPSSVISLPRTPGSYARGETVRIRCASPSYHAECRYSLLKFGEEANFTLMSSSSPTCEATFVLANVTATSGGRYACRFQMWRPPRVYNSTTSASVDVIVTDQPAKPSIHLNRSPGLYIRGESFSVECGAPEHYPVARFYFYVDGRETFTRGEGGEASGLASSAFPTLNISGSAQCTCRYETKVAGIYRNSTISDPVQVTVTDHLPKPLISMGTSSDALFPGATVHMTCTSPTDLPVTRFYLSRNGSDAYAAKERYFDMGDSARFTLRHLNRSNEGNYTCHYEAEISGRLYTSMVSDPLQVMLSERLRLRLVSGSGNCSGRAEVYHRKRWRSICGSGWDLADANVVCQQLGCGFAEAVAAFGRGAWPPMPNEVNCGGAEGFLWNCGSNAWQEKECTDGEGAGVVCNADHGEKPTIYGESPFDTFLRGHGLRIGCDAPYEFPNLTFYLYKDGVFELSATASRSAAFRFRNISKQDEGNYTCLYQTEISGQSYNSTISDTLEVIISDFVSNDVNLRLANGLSPCSGRLEVFYNGEWGTVCEDGWLISNADVVCRDLNCGFAEQSTDSSVYGEGTGPIWLHHVGCAGTELSFWLCSSLSHQDHNCAHSDDVGVSCSDFPPRPSISLNRPSGSFLPGETVRIECWAHSHYSVTGFYLSRFSGESLVMFQQSSQARYIATFTVRALGTNAQGRYSCHYGMSSRGVNFNSTQSETVVVTIAYAPTSPNLYLETRYNELFEGDSLTLRCLIPMQSADLANIGFYLYKEKEPSRPKGKSGPSARTFAIFTISHLNLSDGGSYACMYRAQRFGEWYNSTYSKRVTIVVSDRRERPTLSLVRTPGAFAEGEDVDLACASPGVHAESTFRLLKMGEDASLTSVAAKTAHQAAIFTITEAAISDGGDYVCSYELAQAGRVYQSSKSDRVTVTVIGTLPKPAISLSPNLTFLLEGDLGAIKCTTPERYPEKTCYLYKNNSRGPIASSTPARGERTCNFPIEGAVLTDEGDYSCRYRAQVGRRMANSSLSRILPLTVRGRPSKPLISVYYRHTSDEYVINCTVPVLRPGGRIYLYKAIGGQFAQVAYAQATGETVSFLISNTSSPGAGYYACMSETPAAGRLLRSPFSDAVTVLPRGSNSQPMLVGLCLGGAVIALAAILFTATYCKRRGHCKATGDALDLQTHLLRSWHDSLDDGDCPHHETLL